MSSKGSSLWRKSKKTPSDQSSSEPESSESNSTSPKVKRRGRSKQEKNTERRTSPKPSPILKRFSLFKSRKPTESSSRWRRSQRPQPKKEHEFEDESPSMPTWCDHCDDLIWGLFRPCIQCKSCGYTCHVECQAAVTLECLGPRRDSIPSVPEDAELDQLPGTQQQQRHPKASLPGVELGAHGLLAYISTEDVLQKVADFNEKTNDEKMEMLDDSSGKQFKGYIRVTLNLSRPIRVSSSELGLSLGSSSPEATDPSTGSDSPQPSPITSNGSTQSRFFRSSSTGSGHRSPFETETAFYLPRNVSKGLFVTSVTTAQEVISILLRKFKVVSNPRKFALYEMDLTSGGKRRLRRYEEPLALKLLWGGDNTNYIMSLEEYSNDTNFKWEDFTEVELKNFIRILQEEEAKATEMIEKRFARKRAELEQRIAMLKSPIGDEDVSNGEPDNNDYIAYVDNDTDDYDDNDASETASEATPVPATRPI